ncbi:MAG TPA: flagellar export protein FliJ [Gemmatimonadaceae bacterium]|nr:flagellar export protein FliJ [Gemmatimonadaceae bacterium]
MSRFKFRLQRVLELREEAERARSVQLASAQGQATAARDARAAIAHARDAGHQSLSDASNGGTTVGTLQQMQYVLGALDVRLQLADSSVVTADSMVRRAQDELRTAFQARHALESLREKQAEAHRSAAVNADRVLMDEIALTRFHNADTSPTDTERTTNG